jgi:hypothetical protein
MTKPILDPIMVNKFLHELNALTTKYQLAIDGCGCCGSPGLIPVKTPGGYTTDADYEYLTWKVQQEPQK